jgi:hypothetical protein
MGLYRIQHQDGESTSTVATHHIAAAHDVLAYLWAKAANPNITNDRVADPDDRIICVNEGWDFRLGDVVQHPYDFFFTKPEDMHEESYKEIPADDALPLIRKLIEVI